LPLAPDSFFSGGDYVVFLPLEDKQRLVGYVRVEFHSTRMAELYADARLQLLRLGVLGFAGVGLLGLALQFQVARRAADIRRALGEEPDRPRLLPRLDDEFSRALAAATRVRQELSETRREGSGVHLGFVALAQVTKTGLLVVRSDHSIAFANRRALELFGVDSLEALARSLVAQALSDARPEPAAGEAPPVDGGPAAGEARVLELPATASRGPLRLEVYRLGSGGEERLVLVNDPRLLETLETDVRLASQLQGLARIYRAAAHEIKAPLSAVMINLDLLRETLAAPDTDAETKARQQRYVSVLREELTRLNRSLAEILTQTLPAPTEPQRLDLVPVLRELGSLLAPQARRQGVTLTLRMPREAVLLVGHRDRLKQALLNVAVNALEAMGHGGRMQIELQHDHGRARVLVRDSGPGIPAEILERIYDPYFTTKGTGSGIGLYVARALVQLHGGTMDVASEASRGTEVRIDLPLVEAG
jgi:signal transduction histidine kinase